MDLISIESRWLTTSAQTWDREFDNLKVIPSSTRRSPSKALILFESFFERKQPLTVLDAGSGNGRNALHLALQGHHVYALDFSDSALALLQRASVESGLKRQITPVRSSLAQILPFPDHSFDLVLDSYVSCHFIDPLLREHYISEIDRVLRPRSQFFSSQFSTEDEYYHDLLIDKQISNPVVVDPRNGIAKQLYSRATARSLFHPLGRLSYFAQFEFMDAVIDRIYRRSIFAILIER